MTKHGNDGPRVLLYDIETSFNSVLAFDLWNDDGIPYSNILQERHLHCVSYKWLGEKQIHTISVLDDKKRFNKNPHDDFYVVSEFRKILEEADAQAFHYGSKFDFPMLNARFAFHGLKPVPPIITIDTKSLAKRYFKFNSNRLDYLARHLGYKGKMDNPSGLWIKCFNGDVASLKHMAKYNRQDVDILEYVYKRLVPFMTSNPLNRNLYTKECVCSSCGSHDIQWRGVSRTKLNRFRRYQCKSCGSWGTERKAIKDEIKAELK